MRIVTPPWRDRWVPLKLINTSDRCVLLRQNAKLTDVYFCVALKDMDVAQLLGAPLHSCTQSVVQPTADANSAKDKLRSVGPSNIDIKSCDASDCKMRLIHNRNTKPNCLAESYVLLTGH